MSIEVKPYPLISDAIRRGQLSEIVELLQEFPDMERLEVPGFGNWLTYSAAHGNVKIVSEFLSRGLPIDALDNNGEQTAISTAASYGRSDIVDYLIARGARLDAGKATLDPLFCSIIGRSPETGASLLAAGVDTQVRYKLGSSSTTLDAVAFAMLHGERRIAEMIALRNANGDQALAAVAMENGLRLAKETTTASQR